MAVTEQTRTQLIGLSVAMLGQAPGAKQLQEWIDALNDGMSLGDLAEHIADSEAFKSQYGLSTNEEFAADFLAAVMDGNASEAALAAAEPVVVGALNDGSSQAGIALLLVNVLMDLAGDEDSVLFADYGKAAKAFHNKVMVAEYHTLNAKMDEPSSSVLEGVTDDPATVEAAKKDIDSPPADAVFGEPGAFGLDENASGAETPVAVGRVEATDANGDEVTYRLVDAPDGFAIDAATGAVTYTGEGLDHEAAATVELTVHASSTGANGQPTEVPLAVTVNVNDIQESDAVFKDAMLSIDENEAEGMVGTVTATDAEGDAVAYRLAEGSPEGFSIDGATGAVSYKGDGLDHEEAATVDLTVIATSIGASNMATDVSKTFTVNVGDVDDVPDAPQTFDLTPGRDVHPEFTGGDADDTFFAVPERSNEGNYVPVLDDFDSLDGGGGVDTLRISNSGLDEDVELGVETIKNIENVVIDAVRQGIDADLTGYEGLKMVELNRFGPASDVTVIVDDGATISTKREFGGDKVTLVGAAGTVDIKAGGNTAVQIGSAGETESVMVKGGASVTIGKNATGTVQSQTVTSVSVDGVKREGGRPDQEDSGTFDPLRDTNGFLTNQTGSALISITTGAAADGSGGTPIARVGLGDDGETLTNAFAGTPIPVMYSWDHDGDEEAADDFSATPPETAPLTVTAELKFDVKNGGLAFGKITLITGYTANADGVFVNDTNNDFTIQPDALAKANVSVPVRTAYTSAPIGKKDADPKNITVGAMPTVEVHSDEIKDIELHNTQAIAVVKNDSKTDDDKPMPEDLAVTVNKYGKKGANMAGDLYIDGTGSAANIALTVVGDSWVDLHSNAVKKLDITANADLTLTVNKFDTTGDKAPMDGEEDGVSKTLESVTVSGEGGVTMNGLNGMDKLASIDAGESSGKNSFKSTGEDAELDALKTAMGGSGSDTFALATSLRGKLESVHTGEGNDVVMIDGDYRDGGLKVDLGAGEDTFHGSEGNSESRIDGGEGRDRLRLTKDGATYKDGDKTLSIYQNFEILDLGGGTGAYDIGRLGVDTLEVNKSTTGVTANNVGGGTALKVSAEDAGEGTTAVLTYNFASSVNTAGSIIDGGTTNILNVSLMARGGETDTAAPNGGTQSGIADLTITLDEDLVAMTIDSDASVASAATGRGVTSRHYENKVTVAGTSSALEEVKITGDAMTNLGGTGLNSLEYVNAGESGAGVTVSAAANTGAGATRVRLVGSNHDDTLTLGDFAGGTAITTRNVLMGNGGDDMLTGGTGMDLLNGGAGADMLNGGGTTGTEDRFVYNAASESQVSFSRNKDVSSIYDAKGYDVIDGFEAGVDKIHLSKALEAIVKAGGVKHVNEWGNGVSATPGVGELIGPGWKPVDNDGTPGGPATATVRIDGDGTGRTTATGSNDGSTPDGGAANLFDFIGDGRGLFLTTVQGQPNDFSSAPSRTVKNSVALIAQDSGTVGTVDAGDGIWLLVDVDADSNFDADTDMVIFLDGLAVAPTSFVATTDFSS